VSTATTRRRQPSAVSRQPSGTWTLRLANWDDARERGKDRGEMRRLWDYELNEDTPDDFSYGPGRVRWWGCSYDHPA
jgi:hypothetical protein